MNTDVQGITIVITWKTEKHKGSLVDGVSNIFSDLGRAAILEIQQLRKKPRVISFTQLGGINMLPLLLKRTHSLLHFLTLRLERYLFI